MPNGGTGSKGGAAAGKQPPPVFKNWQDADKFLASEAFNATLTPEDKQALAAYTGSGYGGYNKPLVWAHNNGTPLKPDVQAKVDQLNTTLKKYPAYEGPLNRGISVPSTNIGAFLSQYKEGGSVSFPAFTSTSTGSGFGGNIRFKIQGTGKGGKTIFKHSQHGSEHEVLFGSGAKFKVKSVKTKTYKGKPTGAEIQLVEA